MSTSKATQKSKNGRVSNGNQPLHIDRETASDERDHTSLRLWLRLLTCATLIENRVRANLRKDFETTLPRFDLMAQLVRHPDGLQMGDLSKLMMLTGGNVTGITDQL